MRMPRAQTQVKMGVLCALALVLAAVSFTLLRPASRDQADFSNDAASSKVLGESSVPLRSAPGTLDLLAGPWQLTNTTLRDHKLYVRPSGLAIVQQSGKPGQANPPVNLYGVSLSAPDGFTLTAKLDGLAGRATVNIYGAPPLIEDELRAEEATLAITLDSGTCATVLSKQPGGAGIATRHSSLRPNTSHTLIVADHTGVVSIMVDGHGLLRLPDYQIFGSGHVWFGLDTADGFELSQFIATGPGISMMDARKLDTPIDPQGLAQLAERHRPGFLFGAAVALGPWVSDQHYRQLLGEFNTITTENVGKFQTIHPQPHVYNFADLDAIVAMAHKSGLSVHGHTLVFGEANPIWVQTIAQQRPSQLSPVMTDHIRTVVSHYRGQVEGWDVVNEPLADYNTTSGTYGLRKNIWYNAIGPSYIALALRAAQAADPKAGLWINEFGMEADDARFQTMINLVKMLQAQHVPLTGIGFQAHIDAGDTIEGDTHMNKTKLAERLEVLKSLGLKARFSEVDISNPSEYPVFADILSVCLKSTNCTGMTTWGITDRYSSSGALDDHGQYATGTGLPWDEQERPTAGLTAMQQLLRP